MGISRTIELATGLSMTLGLRPAPPDGGRQEEEAKDSSFCEQATTKAPRRKEAKKLYPIAEQ
jgi:hypothetical protein